MAREIINIGTVANDGTGDPIRTSFEKTNDNFEELYDYAVNATAVVLSLSTLNSTYPSVRVGFQVFCEGIPVTPLLYVKTFTGWVSIPITIIV